jgi:hypothetical protein
MPPDWSNNSKKKKKLQAGAGHISGRVSFLSFAVLGSGVDGDMPPDAARETTPPPEDRTRLHQRREAAGTTPARLLGSH